MEDFGNRDILDADARDPFEGAASFSLKNRIVRALFSTTWFLLARWTPAAMNQWRILILRLFGARVHGSARIYSSALIWLPSNLAVGAKSAIGPRTIVYNMAPISIGARVVISQGVHLCAGTHAYRDRNFQLIALPVSIADGAWIATESFVGPGVTVGQNAVLGARAVATRSLDENTVYIGNPAKPLGKRYTE